VARIANTAAAHRGRGRGRTPEPLLLEALRAGADSLCVPGPGAASLVSCVNQTLRGETNLPAPIVRALLQHFEHSHAVHNRWHSVGDEQARCSWSRRSASC